VSNDFDVITGPPVPPVKKQPASPSVADPRRSRDPDKIARVPKDPPDAK